MNPSPRLTLVKHPDPIAMRLNLLGLSTIDVDIKNNQLAYNVLSNFVRVPGL